MKNEYLNFYFLNVDISLTMQSLNLKLKDRQHRVAAVLQHSRLSFKGDCAFVDKIYILYC